jgi:hypothetical protein
MRRLVGTCEVVLGGLKSLVGGSAASMMLKEGVVEEWHLTVS